MGILMPDPFCW